MPNFDRAALKAELEVDEGRRATVYDDATGFAVVKGHTMLGEPTIGIGHNCAQNALADDVIDLQFDHDVDAKAAELIQALPWVIGLSDARQRALLNCSFNLGVHGLLKFGTFLSLLEGGNYGGAADDLIATPWAKEVGARATRIEAQIRNG